MILETVSAATFTRPANTTAYAAGDLVGNSSNDSSMVALTFTDACGPNQGARVKRARLTKSDGADVANAAFRLHLFSSAPDFVSAGDNATLVSTTPNAAGWLGYIDIAAMFGLQDGAVGQGAPPAGTGNEIIIPPKAGSTVYGVLEARGAYEPASAETFTVTLELERFPWAP